MSSCKMSNQDSDEEVDLEALRLAALKSRKAKFGPRINHNNLIPIVPIAIQTSEFDETKIKKEKISPIPENNDKNELKIGDISKENEDDKTSNDSGSTLENDQDILSVDDKEEEDSLERLMDQLEAEISGQVPVITNKIAVSKDRKVKKRKSSKKKKEHIDDEVELLKVTKGKEPGDIIEIRESLTPENAAKDIKKPSQEMSPSRRSRSHFRSWSRSPYPVGRGYRRSRSPYRSKSPYWICRHSRSPNRKSRSPLRRYRSPRKRSCYSRYSRSRSKSFDRRRSPWSLSPRRRSNSPFYREWSPDRRRRNLNSPVRVRRSLSPRNSKISPRRRSRSPRRFQKNSPFRCSKSPFTRSKSPFRRKSPGRRILSPFQKRSNSPIGKINSPLNKKTRHSKSPARWSVSPGRRPKSLNRLSPRPRSRSPLKNDSMRKSPKRRSSKGGRSLSISTSPTPKRNRSPLRVVEKNKPDIHEKSENPKERDRNDKRQRSLSRENIKNYERQYHNQRHFKKYSPSKSRKSIEHQKKFNSSPGHSQTQDKTKENISSQEARDGPQTTLDPILEARKKKFENFSEVDLSKDREISLKSIKEPTENVEEDDDALTINIESNLWDESEESGDECESRFKSGDHRKNRAGLQNRTVLSFRNLRDGDTSNRQNLLNKPLTEARAHDTFTRDDRPDRWHGRRGVRDEGRKSSFTDSRKARYEESDRNKLKNNDKSYSQNYNVRYGRRSDRKSTLWLDKNRKEEVISIQGDKKLRKSKCEKNLEEIYLKDKSGKNEILGQETDDFDKLISDFEKELESDICLTGSQNDLTPVEQTEVKRAIMSFDQESCESKVNEEVQNKKPTVSRTVKIAKPAVTKTGCALGIEKTEIESKVDLNIIEEDGPEDYIEDDDFVLDVPAKKKNSRAEEDDSHSDLRAVLSRRRNQRLTKVVNLQENMPTRLVQSAFQGLGNKMTKRHEREIQEPVDQLSYEKNLRMPGNERRRVLLLQREKNPCTTPNLNLVPEVKPDTTIFQRFPRSSERRKRKLQRHQDPIEDLILSQEEEEEGFAIEEEKQSRRFRLKRNVTLSSQVTNDSNV